MDLKDKILAVKLKYKPKSFSFDENDNIVSWVGDTPQPTETELKAVIKTKEFKNFKQQQLDRNESKKISKNMDRIDIQSIPYIREWISKQKDAPKELVDLENEAKSLKAKLK